MADPTAGGWLAWLGGKILAGAAQGLSGAGATGLAEKLLNKKEQASYSAVLKILQKSVCACQLEFSTHQIILGEKHKQIRKAVELDDSSAQKKNKKLKALHESIRAFDDTAENYTSFAFQIAKEGMTRYFRTLGRTSNNEPRCCIKAVESGQVVDTYRVPADRPDCEVGTVENSAFTKIDGGRKYFIENDIPSAARRTSDPYKNKRLRDVAKWHEYKKRGVFSRWKSKRTDRPGEDIKWRSCWKDGDSDLGYKSFYKSTLVVPMTIRGARLGEAKKKLLVDNNESVADDEKLLYGFLCVDHVFTKFFNPERDVAVATLYADLASLPFINVSLLTKCSKTYSAGREYLKINDPEGYKKLLENPAS